MMKVWITKLALTQGICEVDAERCDSIDPNMIRVPGQFNGMYHGEGKEWHLTRESAINKAENMRLKKIESLKKQIVALEKLDFKD